MPCQVLPYSKTFMKEIGCYPSENSNSLRYPLPYKTCGNTNPYYKCFDFYYAKSSGRYINTCQLEDYYADFIRKGISIMPDQNVYGYYRLIVEYVRAAYYQIINEVKITYSNLSPQCSAVYLLKKVLASLFCHDEATKIIEMLKLNIMCK